MSGQPGVGNRYELQAHVDNAIIFTHLPMARVRSS